MKEYTIKDLINNPYGDFVDDINYFKDVVHKNAVNKGFYDEPPTFPELIALIHCELSEALQDYGNNAEIDEITYDNKPDGIPIELADVILRVLDLCGHYNIDIGAALIKKYKYNLTRPYRHGDKKC